MTVIKICGLTSVEDAVETARLNVQIIGLVFAESRRHVSPQQAAGICAAVKKLPVRPAIAGVFVNEEPQTVNETVRLCGLDVVQLSGNESRDYCCHIDAPVIKAIHVSPSSRSADIVRKIRGDAQDGLKVIFLLDTGDAEKYGGTGKSFDRDIAREIAASSPVIIAGGLDPLNVSGMVEYVRPMGVDVSSGVETGGRKDINKIRAFVEAVRSVDKPAYQNRDLLNKYILKGELNAT